jgi:hypothetical protein
MNDLVASASCVMVLLVTQDEQSLTLQIKPGKDPVVGYAKGSSRWSGACRPPASRSRAPSSWCRLEH